MKWAYGVTTVPARSASILMQTLISLEEAGFEEPRIFLDGGTIKNLAGYGRDATIRRTPIGCWGNWILGIWELYVREPNADRYAMFQDDIDMSEGTRLYLEQCQFKGPVYWNLYTGADIVSEQSGWSDSNDGRGALALVFDRPGLLSLLGSQHIIAKCAVPHKSQTNIDGAIYLAMNRLGWTQKVHYPSLVKHRGVDSTLSNKKWPDEGSAKTLPMDGT